MLDGQVYDPTDPMGKMVFNILATFAEFEVDLPRMRTREGMAVARAKVKLRTSAKIEQTADIQVFRVGTRTSVAIRKPKTMSSVRPYSG